MEQLSFIYEQFCNKRDQVEQDFENKGRNEFEYTENQIKCLELEEPFGQALAEQVLSLNLKKIILNELAQKSF